MERLESGEARGSEVAALGRAKKLARSRGILD